MIIASFGGCVLGGTSTHWLRGEQKNANSDSEVPAASITGFAPAAGGAGGTITISGQHLGTATSVTFGGGPNATVTENTDTRIVAVVPAGSASGNVAITT